MATQLGGLRIDAYFFGIERINDCYIAFVEKDKAKKCVKLETVSVETFAQAEEKLTELVQKYQPYFDD